tara:strand:+ start:11494 stop:11802 length:309 start_codon:yes stop_codon:yes gene_type:complete
MKINELESNKKVVNLVAVAIEMGDARETTTGKEVQEGVLEDETGKVKLTLWGEEVNQVKVGEKIIIETGWCKSWAPPNGQEELQVSTGKFGKLKKVPESAKK